MTCYGGKSLVPASCIRLCFMTPEILTIIGIGIALAGLILNGQRVLRAEITGLRAEVGQLRERMAHLEGLLEGLREAITHSRVA